MTNEEMKPGRFLKMARGRKIFAGMNRCWDKGGVVVIATGLRAAQIKANARECVVLGKSGSLYIRRGKSMDCIDFCAIKAFV